MNILKCLESDNRSWKNQRYFWDNYGSSYTQQISRMRRNGYDIIDRWTNKVGGTKEYRLISKPDEPNQPDMPKPDLEAHHEAENRSYDPLQTTLL